MMSNLVRFACATVGLTALACGTITHGPNQELPVNSTPPGATARAVCADGTAAETVTPGKLLLRRNAEGCAVTISKDGYETETIALQRRKSAAMVGNVGTSTLSAVGGLIVGVVACAIARGNSSTENACALVGGIGGLLLPGWLDARTGAMYTQRPAQIDVELRKR